MSGSRNFRQGGSMSVWHKKLWCFFFFFFSPQLILQKSNGQFQRNLSFFKVPEGVQHFPGGVQLFPGGVQLLIPYRNPDNLWFSRGVWTPCPPLWIRTWSLLFSNPYIQCMLIYGPRREKTCLRGLRTTQAQTSLPIRADWSAPLLFAFWKRKFMRNFIFLASLCSWAGWFEYHLVGNPEDMISRDKAHMVVIHCKWNLKFRGR